MTCYQSIKVPRVINIKRAWGKKQGNMRTSSKRLITKDFVKQLRIKATLRRHVTIIKCKRDYEPIYIGNEGVKHNTKFEEQMN